MVLKFKNGWLLQAPPQQSQKKKNLLESHYQNTVYINCRVHYNRDPLGPEAGGEE
jgi:hypothetical protein